MSSFRHFSWRFGTNASAKTAVISNITPKGKFSASASDDARLSANDNPANEQHMSNAAPYSSIEKVFLVSRIPNIMVGTSFELLKATFTG